jgi:hypothetical protein
MNSWYRAPVWRPVSPVAPGSPSAAGVSSLSFHQFHQRHVWVSARMLMALSQHTKFNVPVVLQTDRARAKTRKQDTTRPRNRFLAGADSQLCRR